MNFISYLVQNFYSIIILLCLLESEHEGEKVHKLLIVDDNSLIRDTLKKFINWHELGFTICGEAGNGADALEQIKFTCPDVILLDIRMPVMSGMELMDQLNSQYQDIYIVILSAYDEFTYAKKALEVGAVDYILKPFDKDKINDVFNNIKTKIDKKKETAYFSYELASKKNAMIFNNILRKNNDSQYVAQQLGSTGLHTNCEKYALICIYIKNFIFDSAIMGNDTQLLETSIGKIILESYSEMDCCQVFFNEPGKVTAVIGYKGSDDDIIIHGRKMIKMINQILSLDVKLLYEYDIDKLSKIIICYMEIQRFMKYKLYYRQNYMNNAVLPTITGGSEKFEISIRDIPSKISVNLAAGEFNKILEYIESTFTIIKNNKLLMDEEIYGIYSGFISGVFYYAEQLNINSEELLHNKNATYNEFTIYNTVDEIRENLIDLFKFVFEKMDHIKGTKNTKVIEAAKMFILDHFSEDITLNDLAKHIYMHPVYFCTIFKKETGETFNSYLTNIRLDKAFELLKQPNCKVYDISNAVGYKSSKHFSRLFKKRFGLMPKDYKNKILN
jgi:Response regulator containing CheY-like receiver domain and AraC-type DNA-binding domain